MPFAVPGPPGQAGASGTASLIVQDDGATIGTATVFNFTGAGGTASFSNGTATVNMSGGAGANYFSRRVTTSPDGAAQTITINSSTYIEVFATEFYHDWDQFPATHFQINAVGSANASGTIFLQLAAAATPTNPVSAGGDDLAIPFATTQGYSSGWVAVNDAMSGNTLMLVALRGSNSTVDLVHRGIDVAFKID